MERIDEGALKWGLLAATIVVLEFTGNETLTSAFNRALEHDKMKYVALGALAFTASHLLGTTPREIDPYYIIQDNIHRIKRTPEN
jgi:hypothetical protein